MVVLILILVITGALLLLAPNSKRAAGSPRAKPSGFALKIKVVLGALGIVAVTFWMIVRPVLRGEPGGARDALVVVALYVPLSLLVLYGVHRWRPGGKTGEPWVVRLLGLSVLLAFVVSLDSLLLSRPPVRPHSQTSYSQGRARAAPDPDAREQALYRTRCERIRRFVCFGEEEPLCASHDYYATCAIDGEPALQDALNQFTLLTHEQMLRTQATTRRQGE